MSLFELCYDLPFEPDEDPADLNDALLEWIEHFDTIPLDELETSFAVQCENCGRKHYNPRECPSCSWRVL